MSRAILVSGIILGYLSMTLGCTCIPTSLKFIDNLKVRQLVLHARILGHVITGNGSPTIAHYRGVTKVEVVHSFKGGLWVDTLLHVNTSPGMCGSSLQHLRVGQEVFLKAALTQDLNWAKDIYDYTKEAYPSANDSLIYELEEYYPAIVTANCDVSILPVENGIAKGRITKNSSRQMNRYSRLVKRDSNKAYDYYDKKIRGVDRRQKFSTEKMYAIIRRRIRPKHQLGI